MRSLALLLFAAFAFSTPLSAARPTSHKVSRKLPPSVRKARKAVDSRALTLLKKQLYSDTDFRPRQPQKKLEAFVHQYSWLRRQSDTLEKIIALSSFSPSVNVVLSKRRTKVEYRMRRLYLNLLSNFTDGRNFNPSEIKDIYSLADGTLQLRTQSNQTKPVENWKTLQLTLGKFNNQFLSLDSSDPLLFNDIDPIDFDDI